jgi:hypothetical protein
LTAYERRLIEKLVSTPRQGVYTFWCREDMEILVSSREFVDYWGIAPGSGLRLKIFSIIPPGIAGTITDQITENRGDSRL